MLFSLRNFAFKQLNLLVSVGQFAACGSLAAFCTFAVGAPGSKITYSRSNGGTEVRIIDTKTMSDVALTEGEEGINGIGWTVLHKGKTALFNAKPAGESGAGLYATSLKKNKRIKISGDLVNGGDVRTFSPTAKGRYVFFRADKDTNNLLELYRTDVRRGKVSKVNITSGTVPVLAPYNDSTLPNGSGVVYRAKYDGAQEYNLYLAMLKEPSPRKVNPDPVNPNAVLSGTWTDLKGKGVYFRWDANTPGIGEHFRYDIKTRAVVQLNKPMASFSSILSYTIDPAGRYFYYVADHDIDEKFELYQVDVQTGLANKISEELPVGGRVGMDFCLDQKGQTLYYTSNGITSATREAFALNLKTHEYTQLTDPGVNILGITIDDRGCLYYKTNIDQTTNTIVFRKNLKTGQVSPLLSPEIPAGVLQSMQISYSGQDVVFSIKDPDTEFTRRFYQNVFNGTTIEFGAGYPGSNPSIMTGNRYLDDSVWY